MKVIGIIMSLPCHIVRSRDILIVSFLSGWMSLTSGVIVHLFSVTTGFTPMIFFQGC